jgi:hypothetical protein
MKKWVTWPFKSEPVLYECIVPECQNQTDVPGGPFCTKHGWEDMPMHAEFLAADEARKRRDQDLADLERILDCAEELSSTAAFKLAQGEGSKTPCEFPNCNLSQEEHHRLAYGFMNEIKRLRRRVEELEHGTEPRDS